MVSKASNGGIQFSIRVNLESDATKRTLVRGEYIYVPADNGMMSGYVGGAYLITEAVDGFRLAFVSGNIASGTVKLLGIVR